MGFGGGVFGEPPSPREPRGGRPVARVFANGAVVLVLFFFLWLNFHQSFDGLDAGNANFAENGGDMQASFDEVASCRSPDLYDSYEFRNLLSEAS